MNILKIFCQVSDDDFLLNNTPLSGRPIKIDSYQDITWEWSLSYDKACKLLFYGIQLSKFCEKYFPQTWLHNSYMFLKSFFFFG